MNYTFSFQPSAEKLSGKHKPFCLSAGNDTSWQGCWVGTACSPVSFYVLRFCILIFNQLQIKNTTQKCGYSQHAQTFYVLCYYLHGISTVLGVTAILIRLKSIQESVQANVIPSHVKNRHNQGLWCPRVFLDQLLWTARDDCIILSTMCHECEYLI